MRAVSAAMLASAAVTFQAGMFPADILPADMWPAGLASLAESRTHSISRVTPTDSQINSALPTKRAGGFRGVLTISGRGNSEIVTAWSGAAGDTGTAIIRGAGVITIRSCGDGGITIPPTLRTMTMKARTSIS